ncbi:hypothetical protein [Mesorhizobium sp. ORM16]|uniref:hypothetical protein n=1 Tax=Mesorhizobium sp. ORM16 TaxID=3376989 RepID=UPI003857D7C0
MKSQSGVAKGQRNESGVTVPSPLRGEGALNGKTRLCGGSLAQLTTITKYLP